MDNQSATADSVSLKSLIDLLPYLTPQERAEINLIVATSALRMPPWIALPGPQTEALRSLADYLFFGGAAGGAKTDLLIGTALTQHHKSIIFRREYKQLRAIEDRAVEIQGTRRGYNAQKMIFALGLGRTLELGACQYLGDEENFQGRPHDLIGFDELTHFLEMQFRFLIGWNRTTRDGQRCRVIAAGNPPRDADGEWVIRFWGPWLDPQHPNPAQPGELRWFAALDGKDVEVEDGTPFMHNGELIEPKSRTFIPSRVEDNPYLMATGYKATLQALPEPLRSMMLQGDFQIGLEDHAWQIIPTAWVVAAQARWETNKGKEPLGHMDSMGVDVARGGAAQTVLSPKHGHRFGEQLAVPGVATPNGQAVAGLVLSRIDKDTVVKVDIIGVGGSAYDFIKEGNAHVVRLNSSAGTKKRDRSGKLGFANKRAEWWWRMREALDPERGEDIEVPPDRELRADLCAPHWKMTARGILVEEKEQIIDRIGRSPDKGDAICYANANEGETWGPKDIIIQGQRATSELDFP